MELTYCDECQPDLIKDWEKVLNSWEREIDCDYRKVVGLQEATEESRKWLKSMTKTIPLAVY